jgi:hypothetical protein
MAKPPMQQYSIWINHEEQWDKDDIDPPERTLEAINPHHAAEQFAELHGGYDEGIALVVREDATDKYFEIELVRSWEVDLYKPTTLEALCAP